MLVVYSNIAIYGSAALLLPKLPLCIFTPFNARWGLYASMCAFANLISARPSNHTFTSYEPRCVVWWLTIYAFVHTFSFDVALIVPQRNLDTFAFFLFSNLVVYIRLMKLSCIWNTILVDYILQWEYSIYVVGGICN